MGMLAKAFGLFSSGSIIVRVVMVVVSLATASGLGYTVYKGYNSFRGVYEIEALQANLAKAQIEKMEAQASAKRAGAQVTNANEYMKQAQDLIDMLNSTLDSKAARVELAERQLAQQRADRKVTNRNLQRLKNDAIEQAKNNHEVREWLANVAPLFIQCNQLQYLGEEDERCTGAFADTLAIALRVRAAQHSDDSASYVRGS